MATSKGRDKIKLESTAGTGHFYTTSKNKRTMPEKMEIMKFDPKARKHVIYKETKIKLSSVSAHQKAREVRGLFCASDLLPRAVSLMDVPERALSRACQRQPAGITNNQA